MTGAEATPIDRAPVGADRPGRGKLAAAVRMVRVGGPGAARDTRVTWSRQRAATHHNYRAMG